VERKRKLRRRKNGNELIENNYHAYIIWK